MHENRSSESAPARPWLSPSAALSRFTLDGDDEGAGADAHTSDVPLRYGVKLGSLGLLLPSGVVSDVIQDPAVYAIPKTVDWVRGLLNQRGNLVPVFDLHGLLGADEEAETERCLVVVDRGEKALGLVVDGLPKVADTTQRVAHQIPLPELLRDHVERAFVEGRDVWLEVDLAAFIESLSDRMAA